MSRIGYRAVRMAFLGLALVGPASGLARAADLAQRDLADELSAAQAALAAGDYDQAYKAYLAHATNNPLAQFSLSLFYQYGWGRPADPAEACRWQEKSAHGNIPAAQLLLAECLRHGIHRPADPARAAHWYQQAALSGILMAPCSLAELYMDGEGVPKNQNKAIELCRQVAEKGIPAAQMQLAKLLLKGDAPVRNPAAAFQWMQTAAQANFAEAQYHLGIMLRDGTAQAPDPASARWWLEYAASQGWTPAYLPTAELYFNAPVSPENGQLPATDLAKAYLWTAAAIQAPARGAEQDQARRLLTKITELMPQTWKPDLDRQVNEHFAKVKTPNDAPVSSP